MSDQSTNTVDQPVEVGGHLQMIRRQTIRGLMEALAIVGFLASVTFVVQNFGSWTKSPAPQTYSNGTSSSHHNSEPSVTTIPNPTTPLVTQDAACPARSLFAIVLSYPNVDRLIDQASDPFLGYDGKPAQAFCHDGWALLQGFKIQAGSGRGIALFREVGQTWQVNMFGDNSGGGPNYEYEYCAQYPMAARNALGIALHFSANVACSTITSTSTTAVPSGAAPTRTSTPPPKTHPTTTALKPPATHPTTTTPHAPVTVSQSQAIRNWKSSVLPILTSMQSQYASGAPIETLQNLHDQLYPYFDAVSNGEQGLPADSALYAEYVGYWSDIDICLSGNSDYCNWVGTALAVLQRDIAHFS